MSKQDVVNSISELLYWKLSEQTMTALEKLTEDELCLFLAEARDGMDSRLVPFRIRIDQLRFALKRQESYERPIHAGGPGEVQSDDLQAL